MGRRLIHRRNLPFRQTGRAGDSAVEFSVGSFRLLLPRDHALPRHQSCWHLYDTPIRHLADVLRQFSPRGFCAIDIGANVGDTAAAINAGGITPVLCIEGDPAYFGFLEHNAKVLGPQIVIERCFVGDADGHADIEKLTRHEGTTSAIRATDAASGSLPVRRLESILQKHPLFNEPQLLKIDTDGCDFRIILSHLQYLSTRRPVVFFEYIVDSQSSHGQSLECVDALMRLGYERFLVFDNFGNLLLSATSRATIEELNLYLLSNAAFGTAVYYFDICAMTHAHQVVADALREKLFDATLSRVAAEGRGRPTR